ncbi:tetratricopeptide repeat protein [Marinobacter koreensis]|uniref:Tetratricopeptide repeat protein n=1 Tax=Marinobacter koreensis TaxID=335974 RepID=A0ABW0RNW9_9GAMM|nr:hypothetical protein [Marinobacter koreensis]MCK7549562.1 hypothetical protein [Marinobacter koreensis]MDX1818711.1 hypothetical protein [Marinobacter sp.]
MAVKSAKMRGLIRSTALVALLVAGQAQALPPEHEMRRLMLATQEAVDAGEWEQAGEYLNRLQQMEIEKPADYNFFRGQVMLKSGHLNEAQAALEAYVTKAGAKGDHYQRALELITDVERARKQKADSVQAAGSQQPEKIAVIEPAGHQSIEALRKLYLAKSDREALLIHLNGLLDLAGWRSDKGVVRPDKPADIAYRVTASDSVLTFQEIRRNDDDRLVRTTQSLKVYGVNPMIQWGCEAAVSTCWVYDPRDGSRLMQLAFDRERTGEIAHTLGQLVKLLQAPKKS